MRFTESWSVPSPDETSSIPRNNTVVRLGTRASALARWQADWVTDRLRKRGIRVEQVLITTGGDTTRGPIAAAGGQGLFTKEIQRALLDNEIDLAVHSLKDLPTESVDGLTLAAVPPRASSRDVLVSNTAQSIDDLPEGAVVGTGSRRRQSQLLHRRPDLRVEDIRGNVDSRLRKLDQGDYDAIILAEAGLSRLGWIDRATQQIPLEQMLPAVGQGALGLEIRDADTSLRQLLRDIDDPITHSCVLAERKMLADLRGGCLAPVGAWGREDDGRLQLDGVVLSVDGRERIAAHGEGDLHEPEPIGQQVAQQLLEQGAGELIESQRGSG